MAETPGTPGTPTTAAASPAIPAADAPVAKKKTRPRLLRGLQRIASSPSLSRSGRPKASSTPYNTKASFSCVSLASSSTPNNSVSGTSTSTSSAASPRSALGTPLSEVPSYDALDSPVAPRRFGSVRTPSSTISALPADLVSSRQDLSGTRLRSGTQTRAKKQFNFWADMPSELKVHIFSFLGPKDLVRASTVSWSFHKTSFDGQLWANLDASAFYREIPADSLTKIIMTAAPFIKDLNLRGCVQISQTRAHLLVNACGNLAHATLEGCRNLQLGAINALVRNNENLRHLNLTGLPAVDNSTCEFIAQSCKKLETLQLSWCKNVGARGVRAVVEGCPLLKDLRAGEVRGFDDLGVAEALFRTNNLERLILGGCSDLSDDALRTMIHGVDPEIDILTDLPVVPARKLRHLDISRCFELTTEGVEVVGPFVPDLEGLQISGCSALTDAALEPIFANTPKLTHVEMEDLHEITNSLFADHLAVAPCINKLEHLSISYCMSVGDEGMLPVMKKSTGLKMVDMNNTRVTDLTLAAAASTVSARSARTSDNTTPPRAGLHMVVYDCENVTWTGIREILFRNAQVKFGDDGEPTYPTEIVGLKSFYGYQMTVDEHTKRVLRCDLAAAGRLERKWADYMQANEEAGAGGAGMRRRRRRAREAQILHADEEENGLGYGRRRARSAPSCAVM